MNTQPQTPTQDFTVTFEPLFIIILLVSTLYITRHQSVRANLCSPKKGGAISRVLDGIATLWRCLPFAAELFRFIAILLIYRASAVMCFLVWGLDSAQARHNALVVVKVQNLVGLAWVEQTFQQFAWARPVLIIFFNRIYKHLHIPGTVLFICWLFTKDRKLYHIWVKPFFVVNLIAISIFLLYPCSPPRLLPEVGIIDTMHTYPYGIVNEYQDHRLANQHAAMPSMHCGWSTLVGIGLAVALCRWKAARKAAAAAAAAAHADRDPRDPSNSGSCSFLETEKELWAAWGPQVPHNRWIWCACMLYPLTMYCTVIVTGNHFWMDIAVALVADGLAYYLMRPRMFPAAELAQLGSLVDQNP